MEINTLVDSFIALFEPNKRIYWVYILSSLLIATAYLLVQKKEQRINLSKKLWLHPSSILDYKYFIVSFFIKTLLIVPLLFGAKEVTMFTYEYLMDNYGYIKVTLFSKTEVMVLYTITLFLVSDFTRYWLHRFLHTIPFLWEFHKVHHSAKVLNPLTFYRVHPVENILFGLRYALSIGVVSGVFIYFFGAFIGIVEIVGVNVLLFIFSLMGSNLRHSHIKLKYPKVLESIFISPYQHQIHHSTTHYNKNFGGYLAIWDKVFGSIAYSKNVEKIKFGIKTKEFNSMMTLLFLPFINLGRIMNKKLQIAVAATIAVVGLSGCSQPTVKEAREIAKKEQLLGQQLFFDTLLSKDGTQSCSTCHNPEHGFVDNRDNGVAGAGSLGDDGKSIGDRNAPTAAYAMFSPKFHYDKEKGHFKGGQFWDGREAHLKGQAGGPPLNPVEMRISSKKEMAERLEKSPQYNKQFKEIYGEDIFKSAEKTYDRMAQAIAAFESTKEFAPFDSKYDRYLKGEYDLTPLEDLGRSIFFSNNNTNCASCHTLKKEDAKGETFTNYRYHNIGVPSNKELMAKNVVDPRTFIDHGLMNNPAVKNLPNAKDYDGKMKVPTLRNIAVTGPYMHNGKFQKLSTVVKFYDKYINEKRTINPETGKAWEKPEVKVSKSDLKLLQEGRSLSERKVQALVAFMNLLTDKRYEHFIKENN